MRIAITGEGIVTSIGCNKQEVLQSLRQKHSGIGVVQHLPTLHKELPVGEVRMSNNELKQALNIPSDEEISRTSLMAIHAIREALSDANLTDSYLCGKRVVLVSGTTVGGMDVTERHFLEVNIKDNSDFLRGHDCGANTDSIARHITCISDTVTISTACSSAENAVIVGSEMLLNDEADIIIAGGSEALSLFHINGFNSLMILDHEPCRPFDATRAGLNLGEGAAYVVLERETDTAFRGQQLHAYIRGYGNACDAFHQTASSPNGEGAYLAMELALKNAGMDVQDIDYVNAHGTATPNNDETELVALRRIFGDQMPQVSSTKGYTGHATSAAGSIELVICLLAMKHHFIPSNINWHEAMEDFTPSMGEKNFNVGTAMCNSFGFGGNDSSLIVSLYPGEEKYVKTEISDDDIVVMASAEVSSDDDLKLIRDYKSPMEARRMGRLLKASLITSFKVLRECGVETPDAIVTGTAFGCVENSEKILLSLCEEGESSVKPTLFMQSTHNTISSNIAMQTHCHGYNITYSQGSRSLELAMSDAHRLIKSGRYRTVLVGVHDESTELLRELCVNARLPEPKSIYSKSLLLTCRK